MTDALVHRGPDDEGVFINPDISLGHRRLSILDLSVLGRQPMAYEHHGRCAIVTFNGEIYNFRDIRRALKARGYSFHTETDTEVIPAAYLEWGLGCVEHFNGMWAFALYDSINNLIFLSRDRFGEKPLYYRLVNHKLIFASEIKAILVHAIPRRANLEITSAYLFRGLANQGTDTFFQDIKLLPPAHNGVYDLRSGNLILHRYYLPRRGHQHITTDEFRHALSKSVRSRLISDVPISVSLSSGIDSTSVAALTARFTTTQIKAFTTTSDQGLGDETALIQSFLNKYPSFDLEQASLSESSFCANYREIIYHMDEPFARQSAYVRWIIARLTKSHNRKVLLNGEGADEILGGYFAFSPHFLVYLARHFKLIRLVRELYATATHPESRNIIESFRSGVLSQAADLKRRESAALRLKNQFRIQIDPVHSPCPKYTDIKDYLEKLVMEASLPRLLNCNDKMTMANSVEARAPFLDHEFVDMVFSMDPADFIVAGRRKSPLRQAMLGLVPNEILFRKSKDAFYAPVFHYLKNSQIKQRIKHIFSEARTSAVFSPIAYLKEYERYLSGHGENRAFLLHALLLEEWSRVFEVEFA